jgi:hypothetical protein
VTRLVSWLDHITLTRANCTSAYLEHAITATGACTEKALTMHPRSRAPGSRSWSSICTRPYTYAAAEGDRFPSLIASV